MFTPTTDIPERLRHWFIPKLGGLVALINERTGHDLYVTGATHANQFVGRVPQPKDAFERDLQRMGFEHNLPAALKSLAATGERSDGSYRWLGSQNPPWTNDYDDRFQLHVTVYDGVDVPGGETDETFVYAHWEYRWDTDPIKHYREVDFDPQKGVELMRMMLDHYNISYDDVRPDEN